MTVARITPKSALVFHITSLIPRVLENLIVLLLMSGQKN